MIPRQVGNAKVTNERLDAKGLNFKSIERKMSKENYPINILKKVKQPK